jgi:glycosyltransferase involved in cell wall biosynthesis
MSRPLSFCMITTFYPPYHFGGEAMFLHRLSNALAERGHRVTVVHCVDSFRLLTSAEPRGDFPQHEHVTVHRLESRLGPVSPLVTYLSGRPGFKRRALDRIFRANTFDVVHFHLMTLFGPDVLSYGGDALRLYTMHDHWLICPMYDLWKFDREICEDTACLRCQLSFRRPPQLWRHTGLLERALPNVDLFLAPSHSTIEQHQRRGFPYPIRHLPYFLSLEPDVEAGPLAHRATVPGRPFFLFVGRLVKLKGAQTLVEVFKRYREADLVIAGDGTYEKELRRRAEGIENVRFLGRVHPRELRTLYAGAVAVLVPTLVYETFGLIALEAFANATPVIARDLGAVSEVVRQSQGGHLYRDDTELVQAMEDLRTHPGRRDELGRRGQKALGERWSEDAHLRAYLGVIEEARTARLRPPEWAAT